MLGGRYGHAIDNLILTLIVVSVVSIGVESLPDLPGWARQALKVEEIVVVAVFSLEYGLRIAAAERKFEFLFSFYGLVDLLSIVPFFLSGIDTRFLRIARLLRVLRVLKVQRHVLETTVARRTAELAERNAELERAYAQMQAELDLARAMQSAILPEYFPARPACDGAARMTAASTMGGDFYDFIELPDGRIGLVMADVSGKGVPAAFFMAVSWTHLRDLAARSANPGACLEQTNEVLCTQNPMELFVTVFYCIIDPGTGRLEYANGGHNPPLIYRRGGAILPLSGKGGLMLGIMPEARYRTHSVNLEPGDRLVLYTDGVTEAFNPAQEAFGEERLIAEVAAGGAAPAAALVERICGSVAAFTGSAPQSDDITLTVLVWEPADLCDPTVDA